MKNLFETPWMRYLAITLFAFSLVMVSGCGGCRDDAKDDAAAKKEEEEKKKKKKRKKDYETRTPILLPGVFPNPRKEQAKDKDRDEDQDLLKNAMANFENPVIRQNRIKLGHWYTANFQAVANNFDSDGQLTAHAIKGDGKPVPIPATNYFFSTTRPYSLPKGEWKNFETTVFVPNRDTRVTSATISYNLSRSVGGLSQIAMTQPTMLMKPYQYHMIVLSQRPEQYGYLKLADCVHLRNLDGFGELDPFYYVVFSERDKPLPIPRHALNWTTVAYLIWDDYDPDSLDKEYQDAILDWIHFGGQLIVSGPDCLDKLQTSFLADYLPAHFDGSRNLTNQDLKELNQNWTVPSTKIQAESRAFQVSEQVPLLGVTFQPQADSNYVPGTGEIAIERKVGRGRIVATSFSLGAPVVRQWRSFRSFLNGALLRKPARNFGRTPNSELVFEWVDNGTDFYDPMLNSTLRFLSRDLSRDGTQELPSSKFVFDSNPAFEGDGLSLKNSKNSSSARDSADHWHYGGYQDDEKIGTGGWNDRSGVSFAARAALIEAAGITPPSSTFVLKMLAAYLLVLVPLNWLLFRIIGKVEYAWVAAPIIALVGAFLVIKMAALDIGFVRSNSQIGLLEVHSDYPRAHLSEYSALYTSLSTGYDAELDNVSAQSLPFGIVDRPSDFDAKESISEVQMKRTIKSRLEGFQINSNSTGLLHTEYMLDLGGTISYASSVEGEGVVSNSTLIDLDNACVMGRDQNGQLQIAWIGTLEAGAQADLQFESKSDEEIAQPWQGNPLFNNTRRAAMQIWRNNMGDVDNAFLYEIAEFPELNSKWPEYERMFLQESTDPEYPYNLQMFIRNYQKVNSRSSVSLGRMLYAILNNLVLAPGEYRLIGGTDQRLGNTVFDPESTQTDQQTLVVAHLQRPDFPKASPDLNAAEDFTGKSSLDWERDAKELDELLKSDQAEQQ